MPAGHETDYVVVGAGTSGMAFADVILSESDRSVTIVDRRAQPGGHWNDAYSFVRLHQPSAFYGVCSRQLGSGRVDTEGTNRGLSELASGIEVLSYFDEVLRQTFLPSGRVRYFPMSEYTDDGRIVSLLTGEVTTVTARRKVVDSGYLGSSVPSTHTPSFAVDDRVAFVPINDLTRVDHPYEGYAIIGAGKTSTDACQWLLDRGVEPSRIKWVRPRDSWFLNRAMVQPGTELLHAYACQLESAATASSTDDLVARMERGGVLLRIDPGHWATMFRGATITSGEVAELARVTDVVRLGHVRRIDPEGDPARGRRRRDRPGVAARRLHRRGAPTAPGAAGVRGRPDHGPVRGQPRDARVQRGPGRTRGARARRRRDEEPRVPARPAHEPPRGLRAQPGDRARGPGAPRGVPGAAGMGRRRTTEPCDVGARRGRPRRRAHDRAAHGHVRARRRRAREPRPARLGRSRALRTTATTASITGDEHDRCGGGQPRPGAPAERTASSFVSASPHPPRVGATCVSGSHWKISSLVRPSGSSWNSMRMRVSKGAQPPGSSPVIRMIPSSASSSTTSVRSMRPRVHVPGRSGKYSAHCSEPPARRSNL